MPPQRQGRGGGRRPRVPANDVQAQVQLLNKYLNDSGKPDQFRVAPNSDDKLIQEINPANGEVIGEFPASEFRGPGAQRRHFGRRRSTSTPETRRIAGPLLVRRLLKSWDEVADKLGNVTRGRQVP